MTSAANPPYRAEHVGSLLRPDKLRRAFREFSAGKIDAAAFRTAQDEAVLSAVAMQESLGYRAVTDGEFRRASYWAHFVEGVDGLGTGQSRFDFHDDKGEQLPFIAPVITGKLRRKGSISGVAFGFLSSVAKAVPKITMPSPTTMRFWAPAEATRRAGYADDDAYFADLAAVYREEIAALAAMGARYLQIDEVPLVMLCDPAIRERLGAFGEDPNRLVGAYIELVNACLAGRPAGLTAAMHICRGNFKGKYLAEGSYAFAAERIFRQIDVDAFFLEYDTPRAGDFGPLAAMPDNKSVVLGLVSTKTPELEDREALRARIDEASRLVPLERLSLSPQCGFASAVSGNPVTEADEVAKLQLVSELAREVWPDA